ncbi:MAG: DMT family transporter [Alphaproteobacteria bacterium]
MDGMAWAMLLALSILWGGSFLFGKVAVAALPPPTVALARVGIAALALLAAAAAFPALRPPRRAWRALAIMGALNNVVPMTLLLWAQTRIDSGLAAILNASTPAFTVLLAIRFAREEGPGARRLVGSAIGIAGVAVLIGGDALAGAAGTLPADLACLLAALSYAFAGIYGRRLRDLAPGAAATGQLMASTAMLLPVVLVLDRPWSLPGPDAAVWAALLGLALPSTAIGYLLYFAILRRAGATNLLLVTLLIPVTAIALGGALLGERLAPNHLAGMAVIALGLAWIDGRAPAAVWRLTRRAAPSP